MSTSEFTHLDGDNQPTMVDVGYKLMTQRRAKAVGKVFLPPVVAAKFLQGDIQSPKGPVFQTAIVAGTQAVKNTSMLIPFCHPLAVESISINLKMGNNGEVYIECTVGLTGKTGVEMEALTGVTVAALTVYDMCKGLSHDIRIGEIALAEKTGGKMDYHGS